MSATATPQQIATFRLSPGDVVITKDSEASDDIGVPAYVASGATDLICGYHLALIRPSIDRIDGRFLYWSLSSKAARAQFSAAATGVTRFGLRTDVIRGVRLRVPSIDEQQRVAAFLSVQRDQVLSLLAAKERLVGSLDDKAASELERHINPRAEEARHVPLKHLVDPSRPVMYGIVLPGPDAHGGVLLVKGGDVERGALRPGSLSRVAAAIEARYVRSRLRSGDLLVSIRGSFGAIAEVPDELIGANITQDAARVAPAQGVHGRYLFHALRSPCVRKQLGAAATGATIRGVNIRDLKRVKVPMPSHDRQVEIARVLDELMCRLERLRAGMGTQRALISQHQEALVTAAALGQVDPSSYRAPAVS